MKATIMAAAALALLVTEAQAISRYNSTSMTCDRIKATVRAEGAVILRWKSKNGIQRYGRFVADGRFCSWSERAEISYVPAKDRRSCPVRECKYYDPYDDYIFRPGWR